jgi:penicillin-binding protein-related factor A (putative recombinase)
MTESELQKEIVEFLQANEIYIFPTSQYVKVTKRSHYSITGVSDLLGILPDGRFLAIEVKKPYIKGKQQAGKASEEQLKFLSEINTRGGLGFVATSLQDVMNHIKKLN